MNFLEKQEIVIGVVHGFRDSVLLIERAKEEDLGNGNILSISFPGGKVNPGEKPIDAVAREVAEETGFVVTPYELIYRGRHALTNVRVSYYACDLDDRVEDFEQEKAIKRAFWVSSEALVETVSTDINTRVLKHLKIA